MSSEIDWRLIKNMLYREMKGSQTQRFDVITRAGGRRKLRGVRNLDFETKICRCRVLRCKQAGIERDARRI